MGLFGNQFLRLGEHGERALFGLRRVDDDDVIAHLDGETVVRPSGEVEDAVRQLG